MSMRPSKIPGMLCRSKSATAACVPGDPRLMIVPRKPQRSSTTTMQPQDRNIAAPARRPLEFKYARLADDDFKRGGGITLPMLMTTTTTNKTQQKKQQQKQQERDPAPAAEATKAGGAPAPDSGERVFQVVVMRVSIHCQGCAGKVRKHISKMEGVTSFSIDVESKRVTVIGNVSPDGVLESVSKVKRAEFWSSC